MDFRNTGHFSIARQQIRCSDFLVMVNSSMVEGVGNSPHIPCRAANGFQTLALPSEATLRVEGDQ